MFHFFPILAAGDNGSGEIVVVVIGIIMWAIGALTKKAKQSTTSQKERLRQVRESIERAHGQNPPVPLNPEIARRLPPMMPQRPVARRPLPSGRPATNYDQMTSQPRATPPPIIGQRFPASPRKNPGKARPAPARRPIPRTAAQPPVIASRPPAAAPSAPGSTEVILLPESPRIASESPRPAARPSITAASINRWATPVTLRQQFILTEIFQPPLAMREDNIRQ